MRKITDGTNYTVTAYTRATDNAADTAEYGETACDPVAYRFDASAPVFTVNELRMKKLMAGY
jgi:hypothetical protein